MFFLIAVVASVYLEAKGKNGDLMAMLGLAGLLIDVILIVALLDIFVG